MLNIDFADISRIDRDMITLAQRVSDFSAFHNEFAERVLTHAVERAFEGPFRALNPAYAARKSVTHPGQPILRRDDVYFSAATQIGHPGNILEAGAEELVYGISGRYFESRFGYNYPLAHEQGIGNLPQRAVFSPLADDPSLRNEYASALELWARDVIQEIF